MPSISALLRAKDQAILGKSSPRYGTNKDGNYSVPADHIDGNEKATQAMIREAAEETGIIITQGDLRMVHLMHRKSAEERIDFFFEATRWQGEPEVMEKDKCDDLSWFPLNQLPPNMVPYVKAAIGEYQKNIIFSEFGWE